MIGNGNLDNNGMWVQEVWQRILQGIKNITTLNTVYIYIYISLLLFVVNNRYYFVSNSVHVYHNKNTRKRNDLHLPQVTLAMYQKGAYNSGL